MSAIGSDIGIISSGWQPRRHRGTLALAGTAAALIVAIAAFLARGGDGNAARFAAQMVFRASSFAFLAYYLAQPLARLVPSRPTLALARERTGLALAFVCMFAVFLGCTLTPDYVARTHVALTTLSFCVVSGVILAVVLVGELAGRADASWRAAWRTMESIGVAYFWLVYAIDDLNHIAGPHRVDHYHGAALTILVLALLVRFADSFARRYRLMPESR